VIRGSFIRQANLWHAWNTAEKGEGVADWGNRPSPGRPTKRSPWSVGVSQDASTGNRPMVLWPLHTHPPLDSVLTAPLQSHSSLETAHPRLDLVTLSPLMVQTCLRPDCGACLESLALPHLSDGDCPGLPPERLRRHNLAFSPPLSRIGESMNAGPDPAPRVLPRVSRPACHLTFASLESPAPTGPGWGAWSLSLA
jgi:hypothetical protein